MRIFVWAVFLVVAWTGCAGLGQSLQAPDIRLAGLLVEEVDLFETVLQLKLRVINGNDIPLVLKGIQCELETQRQIGGNGCLQGTGQYSSAGQRHRFR